MGRWMKSPGHRRNILGNFTEIGAASPPLSTAHCTGALASDFPSGRDDRPGPGSSGILGVNDRRFAK